MSGSFEQAPVEAWPAADGRETLLFGPERLNPEEASRLLARGPGYLVVWVGEEAAGKTALCKALYECQRSVGMPTRFAGSWTLLAFEQLAHPGHATARPATAHLEPSANGLDGREILHLALSAREQSLHLLFADLRGEVFRKLADNQVGVSEVPWLGRADKVALLVDGERLCDPALRAMALTRVRQLVERLDSSGLPHPGAEIALIVTKWDRVRADRSAVAYWEPREAELLAELQALRPEAAAFRVAAGDRDDAGIAALCAWLLDAVPSAPEPPVEPPAPLAPPAPVAQRVATDFWVDDALPRLRIPWKRRH